LQQEPLVQHLPPLQQSDFEVANDAPTERTNRVAAVRTAAVNFFIKVTPALKLGKEDTRSRAQRRTPGKLGRKEVR
jgi:hypothetical protein